MASERQIAANRRNARRSTGPKTRVGKRRSSGNALAHGLSSIVPGGSADVEALARSLVGHDADPHILELARNVVRTHLNLIRLREVRSDMFERVYEFGVLERSPSRRSAAEINYLMRRLHLRQVCLPERADSGGRMPYAEKERIAETMRRLLPELRRFDRYESRAFSAKHCAMSKLAGALKRQTRIAE